MHVVRWFPCLVLCICCQRHTVTNLCNTTVCFFYRCPEHRSSHRLHSDVIVLPLRNRAGFSSPGSDKTARSQAKLPRAVIHQLFALLLWTQATVSWLRAQKHVRTFSFDARWKTDSRVDQSVQRREQGQCNTVQTCESLLRCSRMLKCGRALKAAVLADTVKESYGVFLRNGF